MSRTYNLQTAIQAGIPPAPVSTDMFIDKEKLTIHPLWFMWFATIGAALHGDYSDNTNDSDLKILSIPNYQGDISRLQSAVNDLNVRMASFRNYDGEIAQLKTMINDLGVKLSSIVNLAGEIMRLSQAVNDIKIMIAGAK